MTTCQKFLRMALLIFYWFLPVSYALSPPHPSPIIIGVIYNLTGPQRSLDIYSVRGAMLAVAQINAHGGVLDRPLQLIVQDGKSQPVAIRQAAENLAKNQNVTAVIGLSDTELAQAAMLSLANKKIFITSGATSSRLPEAAPGWLFLASSPDNEQAYAAAAFAVRKLKATQALLITQIDSQDTQLLGQHFEESYNKLEGKIVAHNQFTRDKPDISKQLAQVKLQETSPNVIYLAANPETTLELIKQIRKAGFNQPILGSDNFDLSNLEQLPLKLPGVLFFTTHAFIDARNPDPHVHQFINLFQSAYKQMPDNSFAALGYDTIRLLAKAISDAGSTDPDKVRNALLQVRDFTGVTGTIDYYQSPIPDKSITIIRLQGGQRAEAIQY